MNEQLKQMALQAGFPPHWTTDDDDLIEMWEKFAELIIRQCANLFEIEYGTSEVSGNEVAKVLKNHFGVEE